MPFWRQVFWACDQLNNITWELKKTPHLNVLYTWARDTGMSHWSADTLIWQLSIDHNIDIQYEFKHNLYTPWTLKVVRHNTIRGLPHWCYQSHSCWLQFQPRMLDVSEVSAEHLSSLWMTHQLQFEVSPGSRPQTENEEHMEVTNRPF